MPAPARAGQPDYPGVPSVGEIVGGKYRVEKVIGVGGMGVVVSAKHTQLGQRVAVKFLLPEAAKQEEAVERFLREARAVASIDSEHVARVIDVGATDKGSPFMVMELLSGMDLSALLHTHGPRPSDEAIEYVLQAGEAIAQAHTLGIVHRDLKPSNLFLVRKADGVPVIKVLDFGISKITSADAADPHLTSTTASYGTPIYMSPEQVRSLKQVDRRTDVWALGVILHELLTGKLPFAGETLTALCASIASDVPVRLRDHLPSASPELEAVILRCLEKNVAHRFGSVAELAIALAPLGHPSSRGHVERIERIASGQFAPSLGALEPTLTPGDPNGLTASAWGRTRKKNGKGRAVLIGSLAGLGVGVIALVVVVVTSHSSTGSAASPSASDASPAASVSSQTATAIAPSASAAATAPSTATPATGSPPKTRPKRQDNVDALKDRR